MIQPLTSAYLVGGCCVPGSNMCSQVPPEAGAGRWSWGICGVEPAVFPQVATGISGGGEMPEARLRSVALVCKPEAVCLRIAIKVRESYFLYGIRY